MRKVGICNLNFHAGSFALVTGTPHYILDFCKVMRSGESDAGLSLLVCPLWTHVGTPPEACLHLEKDFDAGLLLESLEVTCGELEIWIWKLM